jgi:hypothetical protein
MHAAPKAAVTLAFLTFLGGCATPAAPAPQASGVSPEYRSAALFAPVAAWPGDDETLAPEYSRRDGQMNIAIAAAPTAADQWPMSDQPSLERRRSFSLNTSQFGETVIYFVPDRYPRNTRSGRYWRD